MLLGASSYVLQITSVDENGNFVNRVNRELEVSRSASPYTFQGLFAGLFYNITVKSVSAFEKLNPVPSPTLVDQTGEKLNKSCQKNLTDTQSPHCGTGRMTPFWAWHPGAAELFFTSQIRGEKGSKYSLILFRTLPRVSPLNFRPTFHHY